MDYLTQSYILLDVGIALLLGGILGLEREWKKKPAGLRTNMIISGSAALLVSLGRVIVADFSTITVAESYGVDPTRVLHAVIVGVSFIGAGTILKSTSKTMVRYLTTSATILMAAGIGISIALKQYLVGVGATLILVVINFMFTKINELIYEHSEYQSPYKKKRNDES